MYDFKELNNLNMVDVVEKLGHKVKTSGRNKVMLCPFHDDHHPSMVVYEHFVKCYACDKGLGVINFVKEDKGVSTKEACEWLSSQFGKGREWVETSPSLTRKTPSGTSDRKKKKQATMHNLQNIIDRSTNCISHLPIEGEVGRGAYVFDLDYVAKHMDGAVPHPQPLPHDWEGSAVRNTSSQTYCISHLPIEGEAGRGSVSVCVSSFSKCLSFLFDSETVFYVADLYGIGNFNIDDTMFPIIDKDMRVHNIKIQHYDTNPLSETFFHKDKGKAWWYGVKYLETHKEAQGIYDVNCYFGEHLISRFPSAVIVLVESPKNAILGACVWPEYVWVAAGNKGMLNRERLECMRGRKVLVMPDCDAVEEWRSILSTMQDIATFVISDMVEEFRKIGPKADVGDWVVKKYFRLGEVK